MNSKNRDITQYNRNTKTFEIVGMITKIQNDIYQSTDLINQYAQQTLKLDRLSNLMNFVSNNDQEGLKAALAVLEQENNGNKKLFSNGSFKKLKESIKDVNKGLDDYKENIMNLAEGIVNNASAKVANGLTEVSDFQEFVKKLTNKEKRNNEALNSLIPDIEKRIELLEQYKNGKQVFQQKSENAKNILQGILTQHSAFTFSAISYNATYNPNNGNFLYELEAPQNPHQKIEFQDNFPHILVAKINRRNHVTDKADDRLDNDAIGITTTLTKNNQQYTALSQQYQIQVKSLSITMGTEKILETTLP